MFTNIAKGFYRSTLASLALMVAIGGSLVLVTGEADAAPLALAKSAITQSSAQDSDVTLVRDGCGRGMRFSNSRQACVEDFGGGGPRVYQAECPRGWRYSNNQQACVPMGGGVDPGAAIINGIIGGALGGGGRPRGCGPGMRFSNSRGYCVPY